MNVIYKYCNFFFDLIILKKNLLDKIFKNKVNIKVELIIICFNVCIFGNFLVNFKRYFFFEW